MAKKAKPAKKAAAKKAVKRAAVPDEQKQATHFQVRDTNVDHNSAFNMLKALLEKDAGKKIKSNDVLLTVFDLAKKQLENPSGEVLQYTKENFEGVPGLYDNWKEEKSDIENIIDCFKHQAVALAGINEQYKLTKLKLEEIEKSGKAGNVLQPGQVVIDTTKIVDPANKAPIWEKLQQFDGTTIEEKINSFLVSTKNDIEATSKIPEEVTKVIQAKNLEIKGLRDQILEHGEEVDELKGQIEDLKNNSIQLEGTEFVCEIPEEVAMVALHHRDKLIEEGKIETTDPDQYPNALCTYAIKQLFKL